MEMSYMQWSVYVKKDEPVSRGGVQHACARVLAFFIGGSC
jgi:hypothetical protein